MKKKTIWAPLLAALALSGCTYNLALLPRGPGVMAHGTADKMSKEVRITIAGRQYDGRFSYVQGGSYTLASVASGMHSAFGSAVGIDAVGNGNVLASSSDGHNLRCVFTFSGWTNQGTGVCLTDDGTIFDLQIDRK